MRRIAANDLWMIVVSSTQEDERFITLSSTTSIQDTVIARARNRDLGGSKMCRRNPSVSISKTTNVRWVAARSNDCKIVVHDIATTEPR
jgi:hypothetical protein